MQCVVEFGDAKHRLNPYTKRQKNHEIQKYTRIICKYIKIKSRWKKWNVLKSKWHHGQTFESWPNFISQHFSNPQKKKESTFHSTLQSNRKWKTKKNCWRKINECATHTIFEMSIRNGNWFMAGTVAKCDISIEIMFGPLLSFSIRNGRCHHRRVRAYVCKLRCFLFFHAQFFSKPISDSMPSIGNRMKYVCMLVYWRSKLNKALLAQSCFICLANHRYFTTKTPSTEI